MLLVLYSHLVFKMLGCESYSNDVFLTFRMPLFFFISGYLAWSANFSIDIFNKKVNNRIFKQLVPTVLLAVLYCYTVKYGFRYMARDPLKHGYWFTYCLFQVFVVFALISTALHYARAKKRTQILVWLLMTILPLVATFLLNQYCPRIAKNLPYRWLSIEHSLLYAPYFFIGVLCRCCNDIFYKIIDKVLIIIVSAIAFGLVYAFAGQLHFVLAVLGILLIYGTFHYFRNFFSSKTRVGILLMFIGQKTLPVYLYHYFLLVAVAKVPYIQRLSSIVNVPVIEQAVFFLLSALLALACIYIDRLLRYIPYFHVVVFGERHVNK